MPRVRLSSPHIAVARIQRRAAMLVPEAMGRALMPAA